VVGLVLLASLCGEGESQLFTAWFSKNNLLLFNSVGRVLELGDIEALVLNLVLALDLGDLNGLGDTNFVGGGVGEVAGLLLGFSYQGHLVCLCLVFLSAVFMLSMAVSRGTVTRWATCGHLHCLALVSIGDLGCGAGCSHILTSILIGTDLTLNNLGGLLADSEDLIEAEVVINDDLDGEGHGGDLLSECGNADLSVDGGVGIPAGVLRGIPVSRVIS